MLSRVRHPATVRVHHGDCVGVDEMVHMEALAAGKLIVVHPPSDPKLRAWCGVQIGLETFPGQVTILPEKGYLERDWDIAVACTEMLAAPATIAEPRSTRGSGTWTTVRYARKLCKPITIIYPDGRTKHEESL